MSSEMSERAHAAPAGSGAAVAAPAPAGAAGAPASSAKSSAVAEELRGGPAVAGRPALQDGQIKAALALRLKYTVTERRKVFMKETVVHPMNRAGLYPNGGGCADPGHQSAAPRVL